MPRPSGLARSAQPSARTTVDERPAAEKVCYLTTGGSSTRSIGTTTTSRSGGRRRYRSRSRSGLPL